MFAGVRVAVLGTIVAMAWCAGLRWVVLQGTREAAAGTAAVQLYLALSVLVAIVTHLMWGKYTPREEGQLSAYSVFNPNAQSLLGDLRADQLDAELRHDPLYVSARIAFLFCRRNPIS